MFAPLSKARRDTDIAAGQRFRKCDAPRVVWQVDSLFDGVDGVPYAAIFRIDDPSMRKTVARASLERGGQYERIQRP